MIVTKYQHLCIIQDANGFFDDLIATFWEVSERPVNTTQRATTKSCKQIDLLHSLYNSWLESMQLMSAITPNYSGSLLKNKEHNYVLSCDTNMFVSNIIKFVKAQTVFFKIDSSATCIPQAYDHHQWLLNKMEMNFKW